jgi:assimilatory nitrate reductase catalytic subunit
MAGIYKKGQIGFLSKYSNSMGAQKLGVMPHLSEKMTDKLKTLWGSYPDSAGLAADRMVLSAKKEDIDSLFVIGSNLLISYPDGQFVREGLEKLDFLVVADTFETETSALADVVLPLSSWTEYEGVLVNLEGTEQPYKAALKPVGHSLPAYAIINKISSELKMPLYDSIADLEKEVSELMNIESETDTRSELHEVHHVKEEKNPDYPLALYVIDELHHFGHMTEKSKSLSAFCSEAFLEMSPLLAEKYGAENGTLIRVESEVGKIVLPVKISEILENDVLLVARNFSATPVNGLQMRKRRVDRVKLTKVEEE